MCGKLYLKTIYYLGVCNCLCVCQCMDADALWKQKGVPDPGELEVTGVCELPDVGVMGQTLVFC